ncbi:MAG: hypothetical protein CO139_03880 [Candidatus Moranbacteria bacterium CG_4_9_14_3_um_filter_36_9]|nr:MAG: hypothetical protein CO139_03880 [Candidatus Moranbacteria bacterium CG_4_9_14_3_um_filter_36_9]
MNIFRNGFEAVKKRLEGMRVYKTENGYEYFVYPYKGITPINDKEIKYLAKTIASKIPKDVDLIFSVETDGIFTALPVAMLLGKPLVVARSFDYKMPKSFHFTQKTGYHERELYFYLDPQKIEKVAIIDCILSTGGTIRASMDLFNKLGIEVVGIYTVINKINYFNVEFIKNIKNRLFSLFDVEIKSKRIIVERSKYNK